MYAILSMSSKHRMGITTVIPSSGLANATANIFLAPTGLLTSNWLIDFFTLGGLRMSTGKKNISVKLTENQIRRAKKSGSISAGIKQAIDTAVIVDTGALANVSSWLVSIRENLIEIQSAIQNEPKLISPEEIRNALEMLNNVNSRIMFILEEAWKASE